jgi:hypothetical protein
MVDDLNELLERYEARGRERALPEARRGFDWRTPGRR